MSANLTRPYCSLEDVQKETRNSKSDLSDWMKECINRASRWIEDYCKRDFWFHDYSSDGIVVPRGYVLSDIVVLPWPIIELSYLAVWANKEEGPQPNDLFDTSDYSFEDGGSTITCENGVFGAHPFKLNMKIKGTFGYPLAEADPETTPPPTIPAGVRRSCCLIAAAWSMEKRVQTVGLDGQTNEILETKVPPEVKTLLDRHIFRVGNSF